MNIILHLETNSIRLFYVTIFMLIMSIVFTLIQIILIYTAFLLLYKDLDKIDSDNHYIDLETSYTCIAIRSTIIYTMSSEVIIMKDATVSVRVENNIKNEAESILQNLGIPVSVLINSLYRQIIYQQGIPFSLKMPVSPKTLDEMSESEFNAKLEKGYNEALSGMGKPVNAVFDELERSLK